MLLELGIWSGAAYLLHRSLFSPLTDKQKIEQVFENIKFGFKDKLPKHCFTHENNDVVIYSYHIPPGLTNASTLEEALTIVFDRPVKVELRSVLKIKVYKENLKEKYKYESQKLESWNVPIGLSLDGMIYHDFDKIPHMIVAGATRWGKTAFFKMMLTSLIENHPNDVEFYVLDLKGGLAFHRYSTLKQVKVVASNYKESAVALKQIEKDIQKTMKEFKRNFHENILDTNITNRKFIFIDEAGELVPDKSMSDADKKHAATCQRIMSHIVRVSGGLGYRMIFGTQYPTAKIMDNQIKANSSAKISFRLETSIQSKVAIDEPGAEKLPYPGRAIYRTTDRHLVQTPYISNKDMWNRLRRYEESASTRKETDERGENLVTFG
ncbi:hypothetical protein KO561_12775 [Radiobacillus kanasensis]|uniref:FtsK/SpoIIIE domain-containing protein n=1 Tax=Radiobacillus kanasensis TaxID=2844358 RepID=UPI001E374ED6|nr:FtsK/SpoIIIE domain-containing protein [Radiobacillus kanasensis]UFT98076.1 hypothetical protein KO561_12775 [Radiobacillus kanasensis]